MSKTSRFLATALAAAALAAGPAFAAPTLSISGPASAMAGQGFTLNVLASGVTDLYGYQFDLDYDPTLFRSTSVTEGSFLAGGGSTFFGAGTVDAAHGTVSFVFDTLLGSGPGVSGGGVLATLGFTALGGGTGSFALANVTALDSTLAGIAVGTQSLSVVAAVPEPATWMGLLAGLGVVGALGRRRASRPAADR